MNWQRCLPLQLNAYIYYMQVSKSWHKLFKLVLVIPLLNVRSISTSVGFDNAIIVNINAIMNRVDWCKPLKKIPMFLVWLFYLVLMNLMFYFQLIRLHMWRYTFLTWVISTYYYILYYYHIASGAIHVLNRYSDINCWCFTCSSYGWRDCKWNITSDSLS